MWLLLLLSIATLIYFICRQKHQYWRNKKIPYAEPTFFFGNALPFLLNKENYHLMLKRFYDSVPNEPYIGCFEILNPVLIVRDPAAVINVTIIDSSHFNGRYLPWFLRKNNKVNPLSLNIVTDGGNRWKIMRQKLSPVFSSNQGRKILLEHASNAVHDMEFALDESNGRIELQDLCIKYLTDVIGYWIFGIKCNSFKQETSEFIIQAGNSFNNNYKLRFLLCGIFPKILDWFNIPDFPETSSKFFINLIHDVMKYRKENHTSVGDCLDTLIDVVNNSKKETDTAEEKYCELDIFGNIFMVLAAGFDSTGITLTYALYEMTLHSEIQDKVRQEIKTVLQHHNGIVDIDTLNDLKYLEMVLLETNRKYPTDGAIFRQCTEDYVIPGTSSQIDAGTVVLIPTYGFHYDLKYFPNPEQFNPERFSPENKSSIPKGAYIGFGEGQRICIGMKSALTIMKVAVVYIISKYKLSPSEGTPKQITFESGIFTLKPKDAIFVNHKKLD